MVAAGDAACVVVVVGVAAVVAALDVAVSNVLNGLWGGKLTLCCVECTEEKKEKEEGKGGRERLFISEKILTSSSTSP